MNNPRDHLPYGGTVGSSRFRSELSRMLGVVEDAIDFSRRRWLREIYASDAPLAVRLATFQRATMIEMERASMGFNQIPDGCLVMLILKGVVAAGEDVAAVEAASGAMLR